MRKRCLQPTRKIKSLSYVQSYNAFLKSFSKSKNYQGVKEIFGDMEDFYAYLQKQRTDEYSYCDCLRACKELGLDMSKPKNKTPHDFRRWHDIRIDQKHKLQVELDKKAKEKFAKDFLSVANKYLSLQQTNKDAFIIVIAKSPNDLIEEGEKLNHCVGRMNYDQKFIREESLIFFVRNKENPDVPFVTLEYSIARKKILQCYGERDSTPNKNVLDYVNKTWLPYANRKINKLLKENKIKEIA